MKCRMLVFDGQQYALVVFYVFCECRLAHHVFHEITHIFLTVSEKSRTSFSP